MRIAMGFVSVVAVGLGGSVRSEVIRVPGDVPNIQSAVSAAVDGDEIVVADGVYRGSRNTDIRLKGKAIIIRSENGPANCTIDCRFEGRAFVIQDDEGRAVIDGFTILHANPSRKAGAIQINRSDSTIRNCVIRDGLTSGIDCHSGNPLIEDCVFVGNDADANDFGYSGGGISLFNSDATIRRCVIAKNRARNGGGIAMGEGDVMIVDSEISDNRASEKGGALWAAYQSQVRIVNTVLSRNLASEGSAMSLGGGASGILERCRVTNNLATPNRYDRDSIFDGYRASLTLRSCEVSDNENTERLVQLFFGRLTLEDSVFRDNRSDTLIDASGESSVIRRCTFARNAGVAFTSLGGIQDADFEQCTFTENDGAIALPIRGHLRIVDCIIMGNQRTSNRRPLVGGIFVIGGEGATATIENTTIIGNSIARYDGGGVSAYNVALRIQDSVISGNVALAGAGVWCGGTGYCRVINSIITNNGASESGGGIFLDDSRGAGISVANSIIRDNIARSNPELAGPISARYSNILGGWPGAGNIDADPLFVDAKNGDYHLSPKSPGIDAGDNTALDRGPTLDADGLIRRFDDPNTPDTGNGEGAIVDMGIYEFGSIPPCSGSERLKARCVTAHRGDRLKAVMHDGIPGATLTLRVGDDEANVDVLAEVDDTGRAKWTLTGQAPGRRQVSVMECPLSRRVSCP